MASQDNGTRTDDLSALARQVLTLELANACTRLVTHGPGRESAQALLAPAKPEQLINGPVRSLEFAQGVLCGLWLWHDWLDEAHRIAQAMPSETGSFWHAIMHRREGDFDNAKYWYARCADHPLFPALANQATAMILNPLPADTAILRLTSFGWNPAAFVDLVQNVHTQPQHPHHAAAVSLQQLEWRLLFDHCARSAR